MSKSEALIGMFRQSGIPADGVEWQSPGQVQTAIDESFFYDDTKPIDFDKVDWFRSSPIKSHIEDRLKDLMRVEAEAIAKSRRRDYDYLRSIGLRAIDAFHVAKSNDTPGYLTVTPKFGYRAIASNSGRLLHVDNWGND